MLMLILDSQRANPFFRSPISANAQQIFDLGTGLGDWALDVADRVPNRIYGWRVKQLLVANSFHLPSMPSISTHHLDRSQLPTASSR